MATPTRKKIQYALDGMVRNYEWVRKHSEAIANLTGPEHPDMVNFCKAQYDFANQMILLVKSIRGAI